MEYKEKVKILIQRGANSKLFEMPAIAERIKSTEFDPSSITINTDGTFDFGRYKMKSLNSSRKDGTSLSLTWRENDSTQKETFINKYGIEVSMKHTFETGAQFDCGVIVADRTDNGKIVYSPCINSVWRTKSKYFDNGDWKMASNFELIDIYENNVDKEEIIKTFEENVKRITTEYPLTTEYYASNKHKVMETFYIRTSQEYKRINEENKKLQIMLKKSLTFAENVRKNKIGKIFFGKQANELLGEKKDTANLPSVEKSER